MTFACYTQCSPDTNHVRFNSSHVSNVTMATAPKTPVPKSALNGCPATNTRNNRSCENPLCSISICNKWGITRVNFVLETVLVMCASRGTLCILRSLYTISTYLTASCHTETFGATSDEKNGIMINLDFHWKTCTASGIILCMRPANERRRYNVTSSPIDGAHTQNGPRRIIDNSPHLLAYGLRSGSPCTRWPHSCLHAGRRCAGTRWNRWRQDRVASRSRRGPLPSVLKIKRNAGF